jgi:protease IV
VEKNMKKLVLVLLVLAMVAAAGCFNTSNITFWPTPDDKLNVKTLKTVGEKGTDNKILLLDIDGVITGEGEQSLFWDREATTAEVARKLRKAAGDDSIKAVVLRINSPGGGVTASDVVYRELMRFKEKRHIPIVTIMMDMGASGGYYIACASDKIMVHPTTVTGSIGVIIFSLGFDGLFHKIGMESRVIKSGELKDMGNPFDTFTPEERAVFQNLVDKMYERFLDIVTQSRKIDREKLRKLADGRVYLGTEAVENGLADRVGYVDDALQLTLTEARIPGASVVLYTTSKKSELNVYSNNFVKGPDIRSPIPDVNAIMDYGRPRIMYMWMGK